MSRRFILFLPLMLSAALAHAQQPVRPLLHFTPGQTLRYEMNFRVERENATAGAVEDPQAPRKFEISVSARMRIDVLRAEPDSAGQAARFRLRGTYEKLASNTRTDVYDPNAADNELQLRRLEGRSVEFTIDAEGKVSDVTGLQQIVPEQSASAAEWLGQFGLSAGLPREGIVPGQTWSAGEKAIAEAPLAGLVWRGESTYLRNEPCRIAMLTAEGKLDSATTDETCAVILTRFGVSHPAGARDATPAEFRRRNLRTSGKMGGSGESLAYVSLATGWLVSVTQSGTEEMDFTVASLETGAEVHYVGRGRTQSSITLLRETPAP